MFYLLSQIVLLSVLSTVKLQLDVVIQLWQQTWIFTLAESESTHYHQLMSDLRHRGVNKKRNKLTLKGRDGCPVCPSLFSVLPKMRFFMRLCWVFAVHVLRLFLSFLMFCLFACVLRYGSNCNYNLNRTSCDVIFDWTHQLLLWAVLWSALYPVVKIMIKYKLPPY